MCKNNCGRCLNESLRKLFCLHSCDQELSSCLLQASAGVLSVASS